MEPARRRRPPRREGQPRHDEIVHVGGDPGEDLIPLDQDLVNDPAGGLGAQAPPLARIRSAWVTKSASLAAAEAGFRFFWPRGSLSSCDEGDFAEAAMSSRTSTILNAGGIAGENDCTVARTFGTEGKQKRSTRTGLMLVGQWRIDGER